MTIAPEDTGLAQRLAFAVVASLLAHAALIQDMQGGTLTFKQFWGDGLKPVRVSIRSIATTAAPVRQFLGNGNASPRIDPAPMAASHFGVAPTAPQEHADRLPADVPPHRRDDSLAASASWPDRLAQATLWPDESGFGPYRPVAEVDVRPQPLVQIEPKFPENLSTAIAGRALLLVMIGQDGMVDQVQVLASDPDAAFGNNAKAAFERARFTPAEIRGQPVATYLMIEVNFS